MQRTYSKKGTRRTVRGDSESPEPATERVQSRKKRKIQVEVISQSTSSSTVEGVEEAGFVAGSTSQCAARQPNTIPVRTTHSQEAAAPSNTSTITPRSAQNETPPSFFNSAGPMKRSSSTGGIAKRMLRKTRTEPSIGEETRSLGTDNDVSSNRGSPRKLATIRTESIIDLTADTPSNVRSLSREKTSPQDISLPPNQPIRPHSSSTAVRTYAGRSRSFLVALPPTVGDADLAGPSGLDASPLEVEQDGDIDVIRESYTDLRLRWGVDNSEDDPYPAYGDAGESTSLPPNMMNDLKSISELRSRGENRRFLDEMGYLFEGLEPTGVLGVRRGSAIEIVDKLCEESFARSARTSDFLSRAWDVMRTAGAGDGDKVLDTVLVLYAALAARDAVALQELIVKPDFLTKMFGLLGAFDCGSDPLWLISVGCSDVELKRAGVSRSEKTLLTSLHRTIAQRSGIFQGSEIISNRLLVSTTLSRVPPALCSVSYIPVLISCLNTELKGVPDRISSYSSGLPLFPPLEPSTHSGIPSLSHVDNILHLLNAYILGQWRPGGDDTQNGALRAAHNTQLQQALVSLCVAVDALGREQEAPSTASKCLESSLRVLIGLTHDHPEWCGKILENDLSLPLVTRVIAVSHRERAVLLESDGERTGNDDTNEGKAAALLDRLCLALGLLTNLVQSVDGARHKVAEIDISLECPGRRSCTSGCRCATRRDAVTFLTGIYVQHCKSTLDLDTVVRGHMAILLGLLLRDSPVNQRLALKALPGLSNKHKLGSLIDNAKDFTSFYTDFARRVAESQSQSQDREEMDGDDGYLEGGPPPAQTQRDTKGEVVANDVIAFLEDLQRRTHD